MPNSRPLHQYLADATRLHPYRNAIEECGGSSITYREISDLSDRLRDRLHHVGVGPGDRVGIYLRKSIDAVASIYGILKAGAAYVPLDPSAPVARNAYIVHDCALEAIILDARFKAELVIEVEKTGQMPRLIALEGAGGGTGLKQALKHEQEMDPALPSETGSSAEDDIAYILYTSGSTGKPKGVMLSHANATSFIDWCSKTFGPTEKDRFSSHAPLHFDLSVLDIHVSLKHGATVILIGDDIGKEPLKLAQVIAEKRITVWYSTPSILSLLVHYGKMEKHDYSAVRLILFAGEVFPINHLRGLKALLPKPKYFNLYGPTETNVCTYYEVPQEIPADATRPLPIGSPCQHFDAISIDADGDETPLGQEGELCIRGVGVMQGYWNLPESTSRAFREDTLGRRWYRTGDIVVKTVDGNYIYLGRRDRMVKKRGYRVELGEIETALYRHPTVKEAAVIAKAHHENGVQIKAYIAFRDNQRCSIVELKRFCSAHLPMYMVPDFFSFLDVIPKTSTDKIDYQELKDVN